MAFRATRPLRFGDCDPSGIAYFPSYLNILVGVLEDYFASRGFAWKDLIAERRIGMPTVRLDLTFLSPGFQGDMLEFAVLPRAIGRSSLDFDHEISANGKLLWTAHHRVVATSLDTHQSLAWPDDIRAALTHDLETPMHTILQPEGWAKPIGYANGVAASGRMVFVGGQVGWNEKCEFESDDFVAQVHQTLKNVVAILAEGGAAPQHITSMTWYFTDKAEYLGNLKGIGQAYREVIGRHFPAMAAMQVVALVEDRAKVEIQATAVIPE